MPFVHSLFWLAPHELKTYRPAHMQNIGEFAALATAICWVVTAMSFEAAGRHIGSMSVGFIRLCMATGFLIIFSWVTRGLPLPTDASAHAWIWLGLSGVVGLAIGDMFLFRAFLVIGARTSMLLMSLVPPITAMIGVFVLGEILTAQQTIGMFLTVSGVAIVVLERPNNGDGEKVKNGYPIQGILLGLGGAFGQAVGLVLSKYGMQSYNAFAATQIRIFGGMLGFAVLFTFIGWWPRVFRALKNGTAMKYLSVGSVFGPFLGVSLSLVAIQYTNAGAAATIMALTPVFIIPPAIIFKKETVTLRAWVGAIVAVSGSALLFL